MAATLSPKLIVTVHQEPVFHARIMGIAPNSPQNQFVAMEHVSNVPTMVIVQLLDHFVLLI